MGQQAEVFWWRKENLYVGFFLLSLVVHRGSLYQHYLFIEHKNKNLLQNLGVYEGEIRFNFLISFRLMLLLWKKYINYLLFSHMSAATFLRKKMACHLLYVKLNPSAYGDNKEKDFLCYWKFWVCCWNEC